MIKTKIFLLIFFFLIGLKSSFSQDMIVSGAGNEEVNGLYVVGGTYDGVNYYVKDTLVLGRYQNSWGIADGFSKYLVDMYYWIQNTPQDTPDGITFDLYGDRGYGAYPTVSAAVLPVELISFDVVLNEKNIELFWQTATEVNNYGFEIERKYENKNWQKLSFVSGSGNSSSPKFYSYNDNSIEETGNYFYRLKQIDVDGSYKYSNIISITTNTPLNFELKQNYPNPFNPSTIIEYSISKNSNVRITVYDILGNEIVELVNEQKSTGDYKVQFDASNLPSGLYFYTITTKEFTKTMRMLLIR